MLLEAKQIIGLELISSEFQVQYEVQRAVTATKQAISRLKNQTKPMRETLHLFGRVLNERTHWRAQERQKAPRKRTKNDYCRW